jgi:magnesium-transporting ATPase (P-type)
LAAFWIVAYTLLVFGIEVAFRGFQKKRFQPRGKTTVLICWSVVLTMLLATWVPSQVYKNPKNDCLASLTSWAMPWSGIALFLNSTIIFLYLLAGFLIAYQLSRTAKLDRNERIAASRTVYYLVIGVFLMVWTFSAHSLYPCRLTVS